MSVALIGGMDRLVRNYIHEAKQAGINLKVFTKLETKLSAKVKNVDAIVIFTNKVSHKAKKEAMNAARLRNIPIFMHHSCGICTLRECFNHLKGTEE